MEGLSKCWCSNSPFQAPAHPTLPGYQAYRQAFRSTLVGEELLDSATKVPSVLAGCGMDTFELLSDYQRCELGLPQQ